MSLRQSPISLATRTARTAPELSLRWVLGYDEQLCARAVSAFVGELSRSLRRRAKKLLGLASVTQTHTGAVAAIQRTDSALRLNVHVHVLALDGVYGREQPMVR